MDDKQTIETIVRNIVASFSGADSTKDWTDETIWFDVAPYACIAKSKARVKFDDAFGNLSSCKVHILNMETRINKNSALVCSVRQ